MKIRQGKGSAFYTLSERELVKAKTTLLFITNSSKMIRGGSSSDAVTSYWKHIQWVNMMNYFPSPCFF